MSDSAVNSYISKLGEPERAALLRIEKIVKDSVPAAVGSISYGMPAFKYRGKPLIYYGAFKNHLSVFPTASPTTALADKLDGFTTSKGTIQFTVDKQLPEALLLELIRYRKSEIDNASD